jgi:hypothetical protein
LPVTAGETVPRIVTVSNRRIVVIRTSTTARTFTVTGSLTTPCHAAWSVRVRSGSSVVSKEPAASVLRVATTVSASSRSSTVSPWAAGAIWPEKVTDVP